jgi:hypothetical protein
LKFGEFKVGQIFKSRIVIDKDDIYHLQRQEISCMKNPNWLLRLLPGRAIIARVEGEMTRLDIFSGSIMLLYGMDGNPNWDNRHCRFLGEVYAGEELEGEYSVSDKKEGNSES